MPTSIAPFVVRVLATLPEPGARGKLVGGGQAGQLLGAGSSTLQRIWQWVRPGEPAFTGFNPPGFRPLRSTVFCVCLPSAPRPVGSGCASPTCSLPGLWLLCPPQARSHVCNGGFERLLSICAINTWMHSGPSNQLKAQPPLQREDFYLNYVTHGLSPCWADDEEAGSGRAVGTDARSLCHGRRCRCSRGGCGPWVSDPCSSSIRK